MWMDLEGEEKWKNVNTRKKWNTTVENRMLWSNIWSMVSGLVDNEELVQLHENQMNNESIYK